MTNEEFKKKALDYHHLGRSGKIEVVPTKPTSSSSDLSLAYTPGVAEPCLEIAKDPKRAFDYTAKGNLVGVISNGSAVLGLGNIGPLAGKPVMEGKGVLFKKFADIDVFDIEIDDDTVEGMVKTISSLEPTFGGINLEDIKAPECFEVERILREKMNIPVFHDDQHGTAIICAAGFLNAVEIIGKNIGEMKVVFNGAGAAAMSCARTLVHIGVKKEHIYMCDSKGVITKNRWDTLDKYKKEFAIESDKKTLSDVMSGADAFMGLSVPKTVSQSMVKSMAKNPIIFAMANPTPEIFPDEVHAVRSDAIMATGRSDFPNQINNVLGFPFIFRGALDVRATTINDEMKLAAVKALANLAKEDVPEEVKLAYGNENFSFGKNYLIPKPFDKRVLTRVAPAVAMAAIKSKVARSGIGDVEEYASYLESRLDTSGDFLKKLRNKVRVKNSKRGRNIKIAFTEGRNSRVLHAVKELRRKNLITPVLIGDKETIFSKMKKHNLDDLKDIEIVNPTEHPKFVDYYREYLETNKRNGVTISMAIERMSQHNTFGATLANNGEVDAVMAGPSLTYPECFKPMNRIIGTTDKRKAAGIYILTFKDKVLFLADCTAQISPSSDDLADIASSTAELYFQLMGRKPSIAFLSYSSFGSNKTAQTQKFAVAITKEKYPDLMCDGEMQADVAVNPKILENLFPFSNLKSSADILIFPDLNSANISYKLLTQLSDCTTIGPILTPMKKNVNIFARTATISEMINMTIITSTIEN